MAFFIAPNSLVLTTLRFFEGYIVTRLIASHRSPPKVLQSLLKMINSRAKDRYVCVCDEDVRFPFQCGLDWFAFDEVGKRGLP